MRQTQRIFPLLRPTNTDPEVRLTRKRRREWAWFNRHHERGLFVWRAWQPPSRAQPIIVSLKVQAPGYEPFDNPRNVTNKDLRDNKDRAIYRSVNFIGQPKEKQVGS